VATIVEGLSLGASATCFLAFLGVILCKRRKKKISLDNYMVSTLLLIALYQSLQLYCFICEVTDSPSMAQLGMF